MPAARKAAELKYKYFTSTLFISPYQDHELMKEVFGWRAAEYGVEFLYRDFRAGLPEGSARRGNSAFTGRNTADVSNLYMENRHE